MLMISLSNKRTRGGAHPLQRSPAADPVPSHDRHHGRRPGQRSARTVAGVISASGYGDSESDARAQALQALSENVAADVEGEIEVRTTMDPDETEEEMDQRIASRASGYFEGVEYSDPVERNGEVRVEAQLSAEALQQTLNQIVREADREIAALNDREIEELVDRTEFGIALAALAEGPQAREAEQIAEELEQARAEATQFLDFGQLTFDVSPEDAAIELEGEEIDNRQRQLLPPGTYRYEVSADGYRSEGESLRLSAHSEETVDLTLVPEVDQAQVQLTGAECCPEVAQRTLNEKGVYIDDDAAVELRFELDEDFLTEVAGEEYYTLRGEVEGRDEQGIVIASKEATVEQVSAAEVEQTSQQVVAALSRAIITGEEGRELLSAAE
ncbi:carboxypeptidase-like regulatory domain-containing protein [Halorhodospira halochloris]|uniref:carboxypeptidase-like regulatory domain-containing protein n=1 Tax=Halorhodospira halochloris TaxID=1052 RepID=UPI001EE888EF|nr:carboxypeptidase-like regulatory domain-containing protein [Halorhodospira halochloris]MCG5530964.1 carboxypeptidase-like regulatory domain-containing protein [Halorhodospira halochloris]